MSRKPKKNIKFKHITLTEKQTEFKNLIKSNTIILCTGPWGTSKTFSACYSSIELLNKGTIDKIILTRPVIESSSSSLGYLPGDVNAKLEEYKVAFIDNFKDIIDEVELSVLLQSNIIEFKPVNFMRGRTIKNAIVIADEIQNFTVKELMTIITRLGENTKIVFLGDALQNDINKDYVAISFLKKLFANINSISLFEFTKADIVRHPLLIEITDRYENLLISGEIPKTKNNLS